jgi:anhydro-N-acetylmuramic acid kinase
MYLNDHLTQLRLAPSRRIVGLMSGTSLDGIDIALCRISGSGGATIVEVEHFVTVPYGSDWQERLRRVSSVPTVDLLELTMIHTELGQLHGQWVLEALSKWGVDPAEIDAIASHGQTVFHAPRSFHGMEGRPHATLQIGDGDQIAVVTGVLTISDFRQKFTALGGEGAPLVPFVDDLLFRGVTPRILLNIGGIANYTWLPPVGSSDIHTATDTGPGNTLIDKLVQLHWPEMRYDEGGGIAMSASPDMQLLQALLDDPWFEEPLPRTTGPEYFNPAWMESRAKIAGLQLPDPSVLVSTATWLSATTIVRTLRSEHPDLDGAVMYLSGGGMYNRALTAALIDLLPEVELTTFATIGFDPDAKEAVLFAVLANEFLAGDGFEYEGRKVVFGKLSVA